MVLRALLRLIEEHPAFLSWQREWEPGRPVWLEGAAGSFAAALAAALWRSHGRSLLWVVESVERAEGLQEDLEGFLSSGEGSSPVLLFMPLEALLYEDVALDRGAVAQRLKVLRALHRGQQVIVLCPVHALLQPTLPPAVFGAGEQVVEVGQSLPREALVERCRALGYQQVPLVARPGEFAVRGGVVDLFPPESERPLRVEFFGNEIESLRSFDPTTQRSLERLSRCSIGGSREVRLERERVQKALPRLRAALEEQTQRLTAQGLKATAQRLQERIAKEMALLERGEYFEGVERYLPFLYPQASTLLDYLEPQALVLLEEPALLQEVAERWREQIRAAYRHRVERGWGLAYPEVELELAWDVRKPPWRAHRCGIFLRRSSPPRQAKVVSFGVEPLEPWGERGWESLQRGLERHRRSGGRVLFATPQQGRLQQLLRSWKWEPVGAGEELPPPGGFGVCAERLQEGFLWHGEALLLLTDREVFGAPPPRRPRHRFTAPTWELLSPLELKPGDYVVHEVYGIGRYLGLTQQTVDGVERDYLLIEYAHQDRLYLPIEQMAKVQRYVGPEGHVPRLDSLTGTRWRRAKEQVRQAVEDLAKELLELQARRRMEPGHAFSPDTEWQKEMEAAFLYQETPSQKRAIEEVKRDMEAPHPMDRIICGDVGFGKTEIALRAAFKACMDGKQVAVLVPTTVLAQQHLYTFRERLGAFPIRVELLSRFRSPREQQEVLEGLRSGQVDIVIGTHRLLQEDVVFKDLGLLIVDEEQRFGVRQKEHLKRLRATVDVLTLTATPIPRTLQSALLGIRDMSVVLDPPAGRLPVETYVMPKEEGVVREAILRELERGGQVFYVHPRIRPLRRIARWLGELVPSARIAIAHGRLPEEELETVMFEFFSHRYDILVCTNIIENGLDVPNANTLLIEDCDRFGLAQLYQLRGRVGRSEQQAYAFLLYDPSKEMTSTAWARLEALREFADLGSGLRLALRDLELRGAGNLLGVEQHGFIAEVGFDLYCQLLEEAVRRLRGEEREEVLAEVPPVEVDLPVSAHLPEEYVSDMGIRMDFYRRLVVAKGLKEVEAIEAELRDRFGRLPQPASNLVRIARLREMAFSSGIRRIRVEDGELVAEFRREAAPAPGELRSLARRLADLGKERGPWRMRLSLQSLRVPLRAQTQAQILRDAEEVVYRWQRACGGEAEVLLPQEPSALSRKG